MLYGTAPRAAIVRTAQVIMSWSKTPIKRNCGEKGGEFVNILFHFFIPVLLLSLLGVKPWYRFHVLIVKCTQEMRLCGEHDRFQSL